LTVVIEVVSPSENDDGLATKLERFDDSGVEEVWLLRTRLGEITCYRRHEGTLRRVEAGSSALLGGVRFEVAPDRAIVPFFADGEEFPPHFVAILRRARRAEARASDAEAQVLRLQDQLRAAGITPVA
jgi:hypothetical protein